jgi:predicted MFS family arabinose efflux permease
MLKLLRNADFARFFSARCISVTGSCISAVVLPISVYQKTGEPVLVALITSITVLPYLLFGAVAGAMGDRFNRRRLLVTCDVISAAGMAVIPVTVAAHVAALWVIYAGAAVSASASVWFDSASFGAVPALVGRAGVTEANSLLWTASNVSSVAAPALGGLLAAGIGPANAVAVDAASFAISALLLSRVAARLNLSSPQAAAGGASARQMIADIREGFSYLWGHQLIRILTLVGSANAVTGGSLTGLMVVYATRRPHVSDHGVTIGLLYAAEGAGAVAGGFLLSWLTRRFRATAITVSALAGVTVLVIAIALADQYALGLALVFCWSTLDIVIIVNGVSIRRLVVPDRMQSRVNTTARMIAYGGTPAGAALGGIIAQYYSVKTALLLSAASIR